MPRTKLTEKYCKPAAPPPDYVKAIILERIDALGKSPDAVASAMQYNRATWFSRKKQHTNQWPLGEIVRLCAFLGIPLEDLRASIRY